MEPKYKINNEVKLKDGSKALITAIFQEVQRIILQVFKNSLSVQ